MTAFDDTTRIDKLGYSLSDGTGGVGDAAKFRIDVRTGQITVAPGAGLDADVETPDERTHNVNVTAIDGDEASSVIAVSIIVLDENEGPSIRSAYLEDITETGHEAGERVPTEMSHPEVDRRSSKYQAVRDTFGAGTTQRDATEIDTDLDNGVDYIVTDPVGIADPAVYYATDPDDGETGDLVWSLDGPDKDRFKIPKDTLDDDAGLPATLAFKEAPDWEMPRGKARSNSNNNVYEVTLVVTDQNSGKSAELPVTVKVINSGEDNEPGRVSILNRQPEIGVELVAELSDSDKPLTNLRWQWYRAVEEPLANAQGAVCALADPFAEATPPPFRYFLDTARDANGVVGGDSEAVGTASTEGWQAIPGADGTGRVAKYTPDFDGPGTTSSVRADTALQKVEEFSGGDIGVTVTTNRTGAPHTVTYSDWEDPKCLRAAFTYDDAVDPTFQQADPNPNDGVNQALEGAFVGSEKSVKRHDLNNNKPLFREIEDDADGGPAADTIALTYTVEKAENASGADLAFSTTLEVLPAQDEAAGSAATTDDDENDLSTNDSGLGDDDEGRLTYSLEGDDAKYFVIVGSVEHPTFYGYADTDGDGDIDITDDGEITTAGQLSFKRDTELDYDRPDDKRMYRVTIRATDPSGDQGSNTVDVIVNITDFNEPPEWVNPKDGIKERYDENGTDPVLQFIAKNPETPNPGPGIKYQLVPAAVTDEIDAADIVDNGQFSINELNGNLSFKSPPNYEKPKDVGANAGDNEYHVAVQAVAADPDPDGTDAAITTVYRRITVIVTDVNEPPIFSEEEFTLPIKENADSVHNEPTPARGPLYLVNRGVGIPGVNLPVAPNLDVGIPMLAGDDDNTGSTPAAGDHIDGLIYELMGSADALEAFTIVPATGQILSKKKLDHELKSTYEVKVKATDPDDAYDTIDLTIEVTNEEERPIPVTVRTTGASSHSQEENSADDLGDYTAFATGTDRTPTLGLDGPDVDQFTLDRTTGTLKFKAAPDYENPRGQPKSADNTNTYTVIVNGTVKDNNGNDVTGMITVTVTVTDVEELGELEGMPRVSYAEDRTDAVGEYTLTGANEAMATWTRGGADASHFMLEGSGASRMLKFRSSPNFEAPADADADNIYMVTVKASYGGETEMVAVTVTVTDVEEEVEPSNVAPEFADATTTRSIAENTAAGTNIGAPVAATDSNSGDVLVYSLGGTDATSFSIVAGTGQLQTSAALDYEDKITYTVVVRATDPLGCPTPLK